MLVFERLYRAAPQQGSQLISRQISWDEAKATLEPKVLAKAEEDLELIAEAGEQYDHDEFLAGDLSPLFWGSAMTDFGVDALLDYLVEHAAPPGARISDISTIWRIRSTPWPKDC